MFFIFYCIAACTNLNDNDITTVIASIKKLHSKTQFRTIYELFNVKEGEALPTIRKQMREILLKKRFFDGTKLTETGDGTVKEFYNIIKNYKSSYDFILNNPMIMTRPAAFGGSWVVIFFFSVIMGLFIDFVVILTRILTFRSKNGKKMKPTPTFADMWVIRCVNFIRRCF